MTVTVGVPVYRGEAFVAEALAAIQAQTFPDLRVLISLDGPDPAAEAACRPFLDDERFTLVAQPERLGWVGNAEWLMARAETPFFCLQPQDDLLEPRYLETLLGHVEAAPGAAVTYCDIQAFGEAEWLIVQPPVVGGPVARQLALLVDHFNAVAFRGLARVEALRETGDIPPNRVQSFACDTAWMAAMARWGGLERVPEPLYRKRFHGASEHRRWFDWPHEERAEAWGVHCAAMLDQALRVDAPAFELRLLWFAAVQRLVSERLLPGYLDMAGSRVAERRSLLGVFLDELDARGVDLSGALDADPGELRRSAEAHLLDAAVSY